MRSLITQETAVRIAVVVLLTLITAVLGAACAEARPVGLLAALSKESPKRLAPAARGADLPTPVPSNIIGLESWALFGERAGAAAAVTLKRRVGQWQQIDFHVGGLLGITDPEVDSPFVGGLIDATTHDIGGIALIPRWDGGFRLNYGVSLTLLGWNY